MVHVSVSGGVTCKGYKRRNSDVARLVLSVKRVALSAGSVSCSIGVLAALITRGGKMA